MGGQRMRNTVVSISHYAMMQCSIAALSRERWEKLLFSHNDKKNGNQTWHTYIICCHRCAAPIGTGCTTAPSRSLRDSSARCNCEAATKQPTQPSFPWIKFSCITSKSTGKKSTKQLWTRVFHALKTSSRLWRCHNPTGRQSTSRPGPEGATEFICKLLRGWGKLEWGYFWRWGEGSSPARHYQSRRCIRKISGIMRTTEPAMTRNESFANFLNVFHSGRIAVSSQDLLCPTNHPAIFIEENVLQCPEPWRNVFIFPSIVNMPMSCFRTQCGGELYLQQRSNSLNPLHAGSPTSTPKTLQYLWS